MISCGLQVTTMSCTTCRESPNSPCFKHVLVSNIDINHIWLTWQTGYTKTGSVFKIVVIMIQPINFKCMFSLRLKTQEWCRSFTATDKLIKRWLKLSGMITVCDLFLRLLVLLWINGWMMNGCTDGWIDKLMNVISIVHYKAAPEVQKMR